MDTISKAKELEAQGADIPVPNVGQIEIWLKDDLSRAVSMLEAIRNDAELLRTMCVFMQGRIVNHRNKIENQKLHSKGVPVE